MTCPRCQRENPATVKFCGECGARLDVACSACRAPNPPANKFCHECGAPMGPKPAAGPLASPESYTPKHLAEKILTSKAALEGERKQVTVLFADLTGSMELLADRDPEEARKLLDPVLEHMMEGVHRYEGTVNQVMGDGIMALFGAPLAHEDHAVRACYAALRMQQSVKRYAEGVRREHGVTIRIRVGLNSGAVVVRAIGSDLHMDYTAVGQTTHLAARMEQLADAGSILLTPDTLTLAEGFVQVARLGPMAVKGLTTPVEVYELTGVSVVRSRLQAAAARGLSRFVGRDAEIEQLRRALEQARQGRGQLAAIVGEPGVGKSRLVFELTHSHRVEGWLVLESGSVSYGKATGYLPVIDLLKGYFKVHDRETHQEIREGVAGKLLTLDRALEPTLPALLALLDVPVEDAHWQGLDPPQRRQRTLEAVKHLLLRESQRQPVLVVFEDLHWIDSETQALLDGLVESLPTARILLLVNYRPEYQHSWGGKTYYSQLRLDALPPESAAELLSALLGDDLALEPLKRLLVRRGNPFFVEESIRALVETQMLTGERGAYRVTRPIQAIEVPASVQVILAARIDRLPVENKQLLQTAAVIGKEVPAAILTAIAELPEEALRRALGHLQEAEFLYETTLFPDLEYTFKHALTHEVAYGSLLQDRRRTLHARIAEAIEALYPDRLAEHAERLAHHAFRGEAWPRAVTYLRQAGGRAIRLCAYRQAAQYFEDALAALQHLPENPHTVAQAIDVRCDLRNSLMPLGEHDRMIAHINAAEALATALDDVPRLTRVLAYMGASLFIARDHRRAIGVLERGRAAVAALDDVQMQTELDTRLASVQHALGNYEASIELNRRNLEVLTPDRAAQAFAGPNLTAVVSGAWRARSLVQLGRFSEALRVAQEAVRVSEANDQLNSLVVALRGLGEVHARRGEFPAAIPVLERNVRLCEAAQVVTVQVQAAPFLALAYVAQERSLEALPVLEHAIASGARSFGDHAELLAVSGEAYLMLGRPDQAAELAGQSLEMARDGGERGNEAWALRLRAEVAARRDPPEHAEGHYRAALVLAEELGMRPLVTHCHLGIGKLYRRTGRLEQAREHLATATAMYREMGMTYWLEQAEAEMKELA